MADDTAQPGPGAHLDLNRKNAANAATIDRPPAQAPAANRNRPQQAPPQPLQQPPAQQPPQQPPAQVPAGPRVDQQPAAPVGMENAEANPLLQALWRNQGAEDTQARAAPHATVTATVSKHRELGPLVEGFKADPSSRREYLIILRLQQILGHGHSIYGAHTPSTTHPPHSLFHYHLPISAGHAVMVVLPPVLRIISTATTTYDNSSRWHMHRVKLYICRVHTQLTPSAQVQTSK